MSLWTALKAGLLLLRHKMARFSASICSPRYGARSAATTDNFFRQSSLRELLSLSACEVSGLIT